MKALNSRDVEAGKDAYREGLLGAGGRTRNPGLVAVCETLLGLRDQAGRLCRC